MFVAILLQDFQGDYDLLENILDIYDAKDRLLSKEKLNNDFGTSSRFDDQASGLIVRGRSQNKGSSKSHSKSKSWKKDKIYHY